MTNNVWLDDTHYLYEIIYVKIARRIAYRRAEKGIRIIVEPKKIS